MLKYSVHQTTFPFEHPLLMYTIFSFSTPSFKGKKVSKTCKIQSIEFFLKALKLKQVIEFDGCHTHFYLNLVGLDAMLTIRS